MLFCVYAYDLRRHVSLYKFSYWGFFVVLVVLAGLRYRIGTDSIVYENFYDRVPMLWELPSFKFDSTRFEPGFMIFQSIARTFSPDFIWLQFLESIVVNLVIFWFILRNTRHRFLCLTFYYVVLYLNLNTQVLREALAVSLFLLAWPALRDGKWWLYYILAGLASFMHTSALFTLLIPIFCLPGIRELFVLGKRTIFILIFILAVGIFIERRFSDVFSLIAVTQRVIDRVNTYSKSAFSSGHLNIFGFISTLVQYCLYPLLALYFANQELKFKQKFKPSISSNTVNLTPKNLVGSKGRKSRENEMLADVKLNLKEKEDERKKAKREFDRWQMMVLLGVYFMVLSLTMFIFGRYYNYFGMFCFAVIADWAFSKMVVKGKEIRLKNSLWVIILLPWFFYNLYAYAAPVNKSGTLKTYQIYYPYYSRLNPQVDSKREDIYRYLDAR